MAIINFYNKLNKKIILKLFIFILLLNLGFNRVHGVEFYDKNNPGSAYGSGGSNLDGVATLWPDPYLNTIRVRVFRGSTQLKELYFSLANSSSECYGSVSGIKLCTTGKYDYSSINSINDSSCRSVGTLKFGGCLYSSGLGYTWRSGSANGSGLNNYLKNNKYSNLKSVLKQMGYTESSFSKDDVVVVEPATLVDCNNVLYFGTVQALKSQNVSYMGSMGKNSNKCAGGDSYNGFTFENLFDNMSKALKVSSSECSSYNDYNGCGYFKYYVKDFAPPKPKYNLTINKKEGSSSKSNVKFTISGNSVNKSCTTGSNGACTISDLFAGTYTVTEIVPSGYDASEITCSGCATTNKNVFTISITTSNKSITITNKKTCQSEFDALSNKSDKAARVQLYQKYGYTNLLNFNTNSNVCSNNTSCNDSITMGCLSAKHNNNSAFSANNLSCYKETIKVGSYTGYCGVNFNLNNNLTGSNSFTSTYSFGTNFKSGQMILNRTSSTKVVATGKLSKTCYVFGTGIGSTVSNESNTTYSSYIGNLNFNGQVLKSVSMNTPAWVKNTISEGASFTKTLTTTYELKPVYSELGTGKLSYTKCSTSTNRCRVIGYGFASNLVAEINKTINVPFSMSISIPKTTISSSANKCSYKIKTDVIITKNPQEVNVEYRAIDTNNPFPGKSSKGRIVGDNWRNKNLDLDGNGQVNQNDVTNLRNSISSGTTDLKYDLNKDGVIDTKDVNLLDWVVKNYTSVTGNSLTAGINKKSTNPYISYIMNTTNNSYDKNKTGPKYEITLTPDTIKAIREYNKGKNYDDYTLKCSSDGTNCKSTFLEELSQGKVNNKKVTSKLIQK